MKAEILQNYDNTYQVVIYDDNGEPLVIQNLNPDTGKPFGSKEEAEKWLAENYPDLVKKQEKPNFIVKVQFLDPQTKQPISKAKVGDKVLIHAEVRKLDENGNETNEVLPVNGEYLVPYYFGGQPLGLISLQFQNGKADKVLTASKSGIYQVNTNEVYSAETQEKLPVSIVADLPKFFVVDA